MMQDLLRDRIAWLYLLGPGEHLPVSLRATMLVLWLADVSGEEKPRCGHIEHC
jgi:hypothetical protein